MEATQPNTPSANIPTGALAKCLAGGLAFAALLAFLPYGAIGDAIGAFFSWGPAAAVASAVKDAAAWVVSAAVAFFSSAPVAMVVSAVVGVLSWVATWLAMDLRLTWFALIALFVCLACVGGKVDLKGRLENIHTTVMMMLFLSAVPLLGVSLGAVVHPLHLNDLARPDAVLEGKRFISYPAYVTVFGCREYTAQYAATPGLVSKFRLLVNDQPVSSSSCQMGKIHSILVSPRNQ